MKASKLAQRTAKDISALRLMVRCLLDHADIPAKALKELDKELNRVSVYRSPAPIKGGGLTAEEAAAEKAKAPKGKTKTPAKKKPAQESNESEE